MREPKFANIYKEMYASGCPDKFLHSPHEIDMKCSEFQTQIFCPKECALD